MLSPLTRLWGDEQGVTAVEYAMLLAVLVVAGVAAWDTLGDTIANMLQETTDQIANGSN
jgi:Flp pilus assembly pilin Flp